MQIQINKLPCASDLYDLEGLKKIDESFRKFLKNADENLFRNFSALKEYDPEVIISIARLLEKFISQLFCIENENAKLQDSHKNLDSLFRARREFVQRHVAKKFSETPQGVNGLEIIKKLEIKFEDVDELEAEIAKRVLLEQSSELLNLLELYCTWALYSKEGKELHSGGTLFVLSQKIDYQNLVAHREKKIAREDFDLTDEGFSRARSLGETHYCIFCHKQKKDSCRSGLVDKETCKPKINPLGVELSGCPLEEKISEMNLLKSEGFSIAALAVAVIDNPMLAGTGHRICNDCMKSCIYQKQDPVDIPQIETRTLKDVLSLPYGFEIYSLLTRWNPLKLTKFLPSENSKKRILVCGLGPAGYTLAHYLLNDGHEVVAIDGLKIEPLDPEISGIDESGNRQNFKLIKSIEEINESLSSRAIYGFGGVAEYGITVRWNKNYLKILRLLLERRKNFRMFGGIRFGSSITDKIAFEKYGFDHVALCVGAGRPNIVNIENNFAKGVRFASDFLMSLNLNGAFKDDLLSNLQIRMPIVVIGGGLTAIDAACEAQAYYRKQIKKFSKQIAVIDRDKFFISLSEEEKVIAQEFLSHVQSLESGVDQLPNAKILYRKKLQESPAYRLNHYELAKAFAEGIEFIENAAPIKAKLDKFGNVEAIECEDGRSFECKTLIIAAGTTPNISFVLDDHLNFDLCGNSLKAVDDYKTITKIDEQSKKSVSFFGDLNPAFGGSVVKAMASAKVGSKEISDLLKNSLSESAESEEFFAKINRDFSVRIEKIEKVSDFVIQLFIHAPLLASQAQIGHIFRLQNYYSSAKKIGDTLTAMEGVAVTVLSVDKASGIMSCIVIVVGASTAMVRDFKEGDHCVFMGPVGTPLEPIKNKTVVLAGGGRGNQILMAFAEEFKKSGCEVIFFAGYRNNSFVAYEERIRKSCDDLIIAISNERASSGRFSGSVADAIHQYFTKNPKKVDHLLAIGNSKLMHEVAKLRSENPVSSIADAKVAIASLNSPMQCMLKGVCAQCLQKKINGNGEIEYFYSCANQDQNIDELDFLHLHNRCGQNSLSEKLSAIFLRSCKDRLDLLSD